MPVAKKAGKTVKRPMRNGPAKTWSEMNRKAKTLRKAQLGTKGTEIHHHAGRPTLLTPELQTEFIRFLKRGHYMVHVCDLLGVAYRTVWEWLERGEREINAGLMDEPYAEFTKAVRKASVHALDFCLRKVRKGGRGWQAQAWFLERKFPEQFGPKQRVEHSGPNGLPIQTEDHSKPDLTKLSVQELLKLKELVMKAEQPMIESGD